MAWVTSALTVGITSPVPMQAASESPPQGVGEVLIEAQSLSKHFGPVAAVDRVSFQVRRGELVGFLGPNGAGKSTTMRMLTGYLSPDEGEARLGGLPAGDRDARTVLGYLPEHTPLHREMRVDRFLSLVATLRGLRSNSHADALERVIDSCDLGGYERRRIHTLSKGYRQRVGLAQALISDPDVLILDEPTSGLDPREILRVRDLVARLARDKTVLISTHVLPEVEEVCRRVLIIAGGRLVADGDPQDLAGNAGRRLVVEFCGASSVNDLMETVRNLEGVQSLTVVNPLRGGDARWDVQADDPSGLVDPLQSALSKAGATLLELRHEQPTLEQVFLKHTQGPEEVRK